jgi:mannosyltransferase
LTQRVASAQAPATRPRLSAAVAARLWRLSPIGVGVIAFALGLIALTKQKLSYDETVTVDTATQSLTGIWHAARATEAPHLAYYLLMKPWLALAGTSAWAARFPAVVFGALAALLVTVLGARLFGRSAGLVAGLTLATAAYIVHWSQEARSYTLAMLLVTLATYSFVRALDDPCVASSHDPGKPARNDATQGAIRQGSSDSGSAVGWWALWAVCIAAAAWVSLFAVAVLAAHVAAFSAHPSRPPLRAPLTALLAVAAAVIPIVVLVGAGNNGQLDWIPTPTLRRVVVQTWDWSSRNPFLLLAAAVGVGALVAGVAPRLTRWKAVLVCVWLIAPFVVTLLLSAVQPAFESRYLLSAAPALALLAGAAWAALPHRLSVPLLALVAAGAGLQLAHLYIAPGRPLSELF